MKDMYVIHKSGRGYYRPEAKGYTFLASDAGFFTLEDAVVYTHPNGIDGPRDGLTYKLAEVASGDCGDEARIHDLGRERDALLAAQEVMTTDHHRALAEIESLRRQIAGMNRSMDIIADASGFAPRTGKAMKHACKNCAHYEFNQDVDDYYIVAEWMECKKRPALANLKQFPFKSTGCNKFAPRTEGE